MESSEKIIYKSTSSYKTVCKQILDVITNSSQVPGELSNPLSSGR